VTSIRIVSPGFPETPGGVTDHTARLRRHWKDAGHEVQALGARDEAPDAVADRWHAEGTEAVLIQYVPFLYGRRGVSRFPERLARAARARSMRTTLFVHETWVPPTRAPWLVLGPIQRRQLRRLMGEVDAAVTPVPAWAELLGRGTQVVYVGSNLGEAPAGMTTSHPLPGPVVFSPFAAGLRWEWIVAAVEAIGADPPLVLVGADEEEAQADPVLKRWHRPEWVYRGRLPAEDVLSVLARARLVLAPFVDGLTGRRTSAMTAASAGAPLVSSTGHLFDPLFATGPVPCPRTREAFAATAQALWDDPDAYGDRATRLEWYREHLDPRQLDRMLLSVVSPEAGA
jgi:hypothetical protein